MAIRRTALIVGIVVVLAAVFAIRVLLLELGSAQAQDTDPDSVPIHHIGDPVEVVLHDTKADVYPVYHQCDGHGHRIFASRHPIRFVVVTDPTCPGGAKP